MDDNGLPGHPVPRAVFGLDVVGYGRRAGAVRRTLRDDLHGVARAAFAAVGLPLERCASRDTGDGLVLAAPADADCGLLVGEVVQHLDRRLRMLNESRSAEGRLRLRAAAALGLVMRDDEGLDGDAFVQLARMLDAPAFRELIDGHGTDLGFVTCGFLYRSFVLQHRSLLPPGAFFEIDLTNKESTETGWAWVAEPQRRLRVVGGRLGRVL
ncbi:hypothetical protein [Actinomadura rupiterrae]|uniref:hypothetical protein n=1 Tax=Actinomadura rupiterrae TaxID=559627 RepID=UPI0020A2ACE7|nr:hypothetical protein [Actinomadura rupiterrae]MCP2340261.1 hypothetical protein [Actinomadura rupiterrae]